MAETRTLAELVDQVTEQVKLGGLFDALRREAVDILAAEVRAGSPVCATIARNPLLQGTLADIEAEVTYQVGRFLQNQRQPALNEQATVQSTQRFVATYRRTERPVAQGARLFTLLLRS